MPIAVALGLCAAAELGLDTGWRLPFLVLPLLALPHLLGRRTCDALNLGDWPGARRWDRLTSMSPLVVQALSLCVFGWGGFLRDWLGDTASVLEWPGPGLIVVLLPYLVTQGLSIDARTRSTRLPALERHRLRSFQGRMFAAGLAPLGLYLVFSAPVRHFEGLRVRVEEVQLFGAAWSGLLLFGLVLLLPQLLVYAWDTVPIPHGPRRSMLEGLARTAGFRHRDLLMWRTGGLVSNAAIVGFSARQRVVLFTDALLADLEPRQLAAVFCHEMGHQLRGHVWIFGALTLGLFMAVDAGLSMLPAGGGVVEGLLLAGLMLGWGLGFGWMSRRFELDADLTSLELTDDAPALVAALERVSGRAARYTDSWRHFSAVKRVTFLRAAARDAGVGMRLRRQLGVAVLAGHALLGLGLVGQGVQFARAWGPDQLAVDLRLGRYAEVGADLAQLKQPEGRLSMLAGAAAATLRGGESPERLVELALEALRGGRVQQAGALLELALLRGYEPARRLLEALEGASSDVPVPEAWRLALGAAVGE